MPTDGPAKTRNLKIAVLIGAEPYQAHHVAGIAWELADRPGVDVEILATLPETLSELNRLDRSQRDAKIPRRLLEIPAHIRAAQKLRIFGSLKIAVMNAAGNRTLLSSYDAIVTPTDHFRFAARRLSPRPRLIYVNHGIGGRAASYSDKYLDFDFVVVASRKDEQRLLEDGRIGPGRYVVAYPKLESARRLSSTSARLFANDRPVVLFNPHSKRSLRSWEKFALPLIRHAATTGEFNLIVAPHAKLFGRRPKFAWRRWERLAVPDRVIIDLGSSRSFDMTYTSAADIYVGDVSSQVSEFLSDPKPCIFLVAHALKWQDNPDFPNWHLGDVAETPEQAIEAIRHAFSRHHIYERAQQERIDAVIDRSPGAAARAVDGILSYLNSAVALG